MFIFLSNWHISICLFLLFFFFLFPSFNCLFINAFTISLLWRVRWREFILACWVRFRVCYRWLRCTQDVHWSSSLFVVLLLGIALQTGKLMHSVSYISYQKRKKHYRVCRIINVELSNTFWQGEFPFWTDIDESQFLHLVWHIWGLDDFSTAQILVPYPLSLLH